MLQQVPSLPKFPAEVHLLRWFGEPSICVVGPAVLNAIFVTAGKPE